MFLNDNDKCRKLSTFKIWLSQNYRNRYNRFYLEAIVICELFTDMCQIVRNIFIYY